VNITVDQLSKPTDAPLQSPEPQSAPEAEPEVEGMLCWTQLLRETETSEAGPRLPLPRLPNDFPIEKLFLDC